MLSKQENLSLIDKIEELLPQTQCQKCSFPGCNPYAQAIAAGTAEINQCPPGGQRGIDALANLLGMQAMPLNEAFGKEQPKTRALIIEQDCIGCTKCLAPCPVDAILGAAKYMHTVITAECTGCELCVAPCPVDCIIMVPVSEAENTIDFKKRATQAKRRYQAKKQRMEREVAEKAERSRKRKEALRKLKSSQR